MQKCRCRSNSQQLEGLMRRILLVAAIMAASLLTSAGTFSPANALNDVQEAVTATCYQDGCDGKGPVATGCDDDGVVKATSPKVYFGGGNGATVQLMYSARCQAFWARSYSPPLDNCCNYYYRIWISKYTIDSPVTLKGHYYEDLAYNAQAYDWGPMIGGYPGRKYRACLVDEGQNPGNTACTGWFNRLGNAL